MPMAKISMLKKLEKMEDSDGHNTKRKKNNNRVKSMAPEAQIQIQHKKDMTPKRNKSKNLKPLSNNFLELPNERKSFIIKMKFNKF